MAYRQDTITAKELKAESVFKLGRATAETLGASRTIVNGEGPILSFDAGGSSRNVTLPTRADVNDGVVMIIHNFSTAGENLVIKNVATTTLATIPSSGIALVFAAIADETPGTREWKVALVGGEDLALADALTVTGATALNGTVALGDATTDTIAFYGTTKISQRAGSTQATSLLSSNSLGTAGLQAMVEIMNTLQAIGIWKGAA